MFQQDGRRKGANSTGYGTPRCALSRTATLKLKPRTSSLKAIGYRQKAVVNCVYVPYLSRPMPKPIARSKTRKAVAKRFKVTASGKVLRSRASRRHLMSAKNAKKKRQLAKMGRVHQTDVARIKANLPFA
jgi:large subunit ribosomal protein L35